MQRDMSSVDSHSWTAIAPRMTKHHIRGGVSGALCRCRIVCVVMAGLWAAWVLGCHGSAVPGRPIVGQGPGEPGCLSAAKAGCTRSKAARLLRLPSQRARGGRHDPR